MSFLRLETCLEDLKKVNAVFEHLPDLAVLAMVRALNKTAKGVVVDAVNIVAEVYAQPKRDIKKDFSVRQAWKTRLEAEVNARGKSSLPLSAYSPRIRKIKTERGPRTGVSVKVLKTHGRKVASKVFPATVGAGHNDLFERKGSARLPIQIAYGPGPLLLFNYDHTKLDELEDKANDRMWKNLEHEAAWALKEAGLR